ncbi:MAG: tRNA 2-thiocytidine biosynthesis TtcA family protein [Waddliaceae bacterium]
MKPPWTKLGKRIESMVRKSLFDYQMLEDAKSVAVAFSGGKDSLTLLLMLKAILGRGFPDLQLHAIHVSGAFSCGAGIQGGYLKKICDDLEINFIEKTSHQKLETLECYSCSRERRKLLFDAAKEVGAEHIAFGHHKDDNIQTVLMNLLHKGEFSGQLPKLHMVDYGVTVLRPLIYISEREIEEFAKIQGFLRIMCRCPVGANSMRKKTDQLIESIEDLYPNARANIASAVLQYGSEKARKL